MTSLTKSELHLTTFISYCACAGSRRISPQQLYQRSAATTAQCQALDAADCAASGRLVRTTSSARLSLRLVHRLLNCRALLQRAKPPTPKRPADCDDYPGPVPTPERPCGDIGPVLAHRDGPCGSLMRRRCILSPQKPPKRARKRGAVRGPSLSAKQGGLVGWRHSADRTSLRSHFSANREFYREFCKFREVEAIAGADSQRFIVISSQIP